MFCPNCGKQLEEGTAFCPMCGTAIATAPQENAQAPQQEQQQFSQAVGGFDQAPQQEQQQFNQAAGGFDQAPPQPQQQFDQAAGGFDQTPPQPQQQFNQAAGGFDQVPPQPQYNQQAGAYNQVPPQQPYAQPVPDYGPMTPAKKSHVVPILIVVIAAAVIAVGVLLFFLLRSSGGGDVAGRYHLAAIQFNGMTFKADLVPNLTQNINIELKDDGTGTFSYENNSEEVTWERNGSDLEIKSKTGQKISDYLTTQGGAITFVDGRIYITMETGGMSGSTILAKEGDDLSDIEMSSLEDLMQAFGQGIID
ncbi:MAG: zinc ribbon domain-containing protein [Eubacterium sp.]|nr:zinc ribbon domain-containing protein [Eubacterium sp.]